MKTVADISESLVKESPYLEEALSQGIINLTSLARLLKPKVEAVNLKKTTTGAIAMALQRLGQKLKKKNYTKKIISLPKDLTLRSNITEYVFSLSPGFNELLERLINRLGKIKDVYLTTAQGVNEATIFVSQPAAQQVEELFKKEKLLFKLEKQSVIILRFEENTIAMPGVYYNVLKALAWEGVPINEVISVGNELSLVFEADKIDRAFLIIKDLIEKK